jgi:1-pyrroline-5-carboxylate dehydrogenase
MMNALSHTPAPKNEPVYDYAPRSPERAALQSALKEIKSHTDEIPLVIHGERVRTGELVDVTAPHEKNHVLAKLHLGKDEHIQRAINSCLSARQEWSSLPWEDRAGVFLKAAELIATKYRAKFNAATMHGQSKSAYQAEIDSACEVIDFFRWNAHFAEQIYREQPVSASGVWNRVEARPLEGFVYAITPFNFTAIAVNLPCSAALMGNTVLWKPARTSMLSSWYALQILEEAGLPPGVINMVSGSSAAISKAAMSHKDLGGVHFTGSTGVFNSLWKDAAANIDHYKSYPRLVGETGGKDFIFAHPSADPDALLTAMIRGAFEYQGQKCSAASRVYIPKSLWAKLRERLVAEVKSIKMGSPEDFSNFVNAVIDKGAFTSIKNYIDFAKQAKDARIIVGGECRDDVGYFIQPTVIETDNPRFKTMEEEIFGPVLTVYPYDDAKFEETLTLCDETSPYALTGAIFARERRVQHHMAERLRYAAGNFYINDKPTGAVVGNQPFGGSRQSGTNDKAGCGLNLLRWVSPRTIKETFSPATDWRYPFLG